MLGPGEAEHALEIGIVEAGLLAAEELQADARAIDVAADEVGAKQQMSLTVVGREGKRRQLGVGLANEGGQFLLLRGVRRGELAVAILEVASVGKRGLAGRVGPEDLELAGDEQARTGFPRNPLERKIR